jgi:hypothetical protein
VIHPCCVGLTFLSIEDAIVWIWSIPQSPMYQRLNPQPMVLLELVEPLGVGASRKKLGHCGCILEGDIGTPNSPLPLSFLPGHHEVTESLLPYAPAIMYYPTTGPKQQG